MNSFRRTLGLAVAAALGLTVPPPWAAAPRDFAACETLVRQAPDEQLSYNCFEDVARASNRFDEAIRRLEALLQVDPRRYKALAVLGTLERMQGNPRAEALFRRAAEIAAERNDDRGIVRVRASLGTFLRQRGRTDEAAHELDLALEAARRTEDPILLAYVWMKQAYLARARSDFGRAKRLFRQAEAQAFPDGPPALQTAILGGLGGVCRNLGQYDESLHYHRRHAELARDSEDAWGESTARGNMANAARSLAMMDQLEPTDYRLLLDEALEVAIAAGNAGVEGRVRLNRSSDLDPAAAYLELERARTLCDQVKDWGCANAARRMIGSLWVEHEPRRRDDGFRMIDRATRDAWSRGHRTAGIRGLRARAFAMQATGAPRAEWIAAFAAVLDQAERFRDMQPEAEVRARLFGEFVSSYYGLSRLILLTLDESTSPDDDLDLAFRTVERVRARLLLDEMQAARTIESDGQVHPLRLERAELLRALTEVQRALLLEDLSEAERATRTDELERLEAREAGLRDQLARRDPAYRALQSSAVASLAEVQRRLAVDQALLAFRVWGGDLTRPGNADFSSWVFVLTRDAVTALPLPDERTLVTRVSIYRGLLENRDGSDARAASRLFGDILADALALLPTEVRRLVLVPDGPLVHLPFETLQDERGSPLARRYEVTYAPSATLWARWRSEPVPPPRSDVLVLADPKLPVSRTPAVDRAVDPWIDGLRLGRLPHARGEAQGFLQGMGHGTLRVGDEANEAFLKQADLSAVGILHFAAHAVVDGERPERSAVVLAPGSPAEDGLLQGREIVDLDLEGQLVILSGCRSADGEFVAGEGVVGLAHAFFRAGARVVVGALWPVRDDETATMMRAFSRRLAEGASVSRALAAARREMVDRGVPTAAWSGLIVLGDGDHVPLPFDRDTSTSSRLGALILLGVLFAAVVLLLRGLRAAAVARR